MAEEEVAVRLQPVEQAAHDARLGRGVEIDEDVAAEDEVEAARERERLRVEVEPLEAHARAQERGPPSCGPPPARCPASMNAFR
jgi:hypothetical protein